MRARRSLENFCCARSWGGGMRATIRLKTSSLSLVVILRICFSQTTLAKQKYYCILYVFYHTFLTQYNESFNIIVIDFTM